MAGWLCQDCLSINKGGAGRCYKCHVPRKFGEAPDGIPDPSRPQVTGAVSADPGARTRRPRPALSDYRSSRRRSWFLLALLTVTVGYSTLSLAMLQANGGTMGLAIRLMQRDLSVVGNLVAVSLIGLILTLATAIAWFVWFDRVLQNVPPLTGRWTELGRVAAVTWWLVPLVGLFRGPYVVGQVYDRVRVRTSPGLWLLGFWAIFWLGGTVAPAIASRAIGFFPVDLVTMAQLDDAIGILGQVSYVIAGLFAAALVLAFEQAQEARSTGATDLEPHRADDDARHGADGYSSPLPSAHGGPVQGTAAAWPAASGAVPGGSWQSQPATARPFDRRIMGDRIECAVASGTTDVAAGATDLGGLWRRCAPGRDRLSALGRDRLAALDRAGRPYPGCRIDDTRRPGRTSWQVHDRGPASDPAGGHGRRHRGRAGASAR